MTDINGTRYTHFDARVERHRRLIRSLCWRGAGGDQDTFLQLWRARHSLRDGATEGEIREWVRLHCRRVISHHLRRSDVTTVTLDQDAQIAAEAVDHRAELEALAIGLTEQEHKLLRLFMEGYQQVEIAALWGMHPDSVGRLKRHMREKRKKNI